MSGKVLWRRPSFCSFGNCVEVRVLPSGCVAVRQSSAPAEPLVFTEAEWVAFIKSVKVGEFDLVTGDLV